MRAGAHAPRRFREAAETMVIAPARSHAEWQQARELIEEYAASLSVDLAFQDFAHEIANLDQEYGNSSGTLLLAEDRGEYLGCVGLRRFAEHVGEIKRLYVRPSGRGRGLGRQLAESIIVAAQALGYRRLVLDTLPAMQEAHALYRSMGFTPIAAYRFNPVVGTTFFELRLDERQPNRSR